MRGGVEDVVFLKERSRRLKVLSSTARKRGGSETKSQSRVANVIKTNTKVT